MPSAPSTSTTTTSAQTAPPQTVQAFYLPPSGFKSGTAVTTVASKKPVFSPAEKGQPAPAYRALFASENRELSSGEIPGVSQPQAEVTGPGEGLARAYSDSGTKAFKQGKFKDAVIQLKEAVRLDPDSFTAHRYLGAALLETGKFADARNELTAALKLTPKDGPERKELQALLARIDELEKKA